MLITTAIFHFGYFSQLWRVKVPQYFIYLLAFRIFFRSQETARQSKMVFSKF